MDLQITPKQIRWKEACHKFKPKMVTEFIFHLCQWLQPSKTGRENETITQWSTTVWTRAKILKTQHNLSIKRLERLNNRKIHKTFMGPKGCVTSLTMVLNSNKILPDIIMDRANNNSLNIIIRQLTWKTHKKSRCFIRSKWIHTVPQVKRLAWMHIERRRIFSLTEITCRVISFRRLDNQIRKFQTTSLALHSIRVSATIRMDPTLISATRLETMPQQASYRIMLITVSLPAQRWSHST